MSSSTGSDSTVPTTRVAIIGYGMAGAVFHAPLIASTPGMSVAGIVTSNPERQAHAQRDFPKATILSSAGQIWREPNLYDLVVVATPNRSHLPLGIAAMNAGLPVVIDKPITASVSNAEQLIATSERTGKLLTVFQNRRWDNDILTVRRLLDADLDLLGTITRFESRFERYRAAPREGAWRELPDEEEAGGLLFDLGSHLIDQAVQLFGLPTHIYAEVEKRRHGALVDDDTFVALRFASGVNAHLWMSAVTRIAGPRIRISGLRGTYEKWGLDPQEEALRTGMRPGDDGWGLELAEKWGRLSTDVGGIHIDGPVEMLPGAYEEYYVLLREALVTCGPPPVDPRDTVTVLRIIEAAKKSAQSGTVVQFEL
jgi:predicted dehydrogenase